MVLDTKPRRPKGSGSVLEIPKGSGVWRVRVFVGADPVTKKPRQVERTVRGGRKKAEATKDRLAEEARAGKFATTKGTLAHLLEEWPKHLTRIGRRPVTVETYELIIRKHLVPALGDKELGELSSYDLDEYYRSKQDSGMATGTVRLHHAILSGALSQAVDWGWLTVNRAKSAKPPALIREEKRPPSSADIRKLVETASDDIDLATAVMLAAMTGARRGELAGLRWTDVDWENGTLLIERGRAHVGGKDQTGPTKGKNTRKVSLGGDGLAVLQAYRAAVSARAVELRLEPDWNGWLLSPDCGHTATTVKYLSHTFQSLGKRAGVPLTPHLLRHWAASEMVGSGIDVRTAAGRLGHTPEMLMRVYAHTLPSRDLEAAKMLEGHVLALNPVKEPS